MNSIRNIIIQNILTISFLVFVLTGCEKDKKTDTLPVIAGTELFSTGSDGVTLKAILRNNNNESIKNAGALWSLLPAPSDDNNFVEGNLTDSILFVRIEHLTPGTKYFIRLKIDCREIDIYSDDIAVTTLNRISDTEGNMYNTVLIGSDVWMKENLRTRKFNEGEQIEYVSGDWSALSTAAYTWYDFDESNGQSYGALYNWPAVETGKLCPAGWHIATNEDWNSLTEYLGGEHLAGGLLKEPFGYWAGPNTDATDFSGFSALPGGSSGTRMGSFSGKGFQALWWESAIDYSYNSEQGMLLFRAVSYDRPDIERNGFLSKGGPLNFLSVRCVKD